MSPALSRIKINNIVKAVFKGTDCSLFVDDFALFVSGKMLNRVERALQLCVNSVQKWVTENGFMFSPLRRSVFISINSTVFSPDPNILLGKTPIKVVREAKFLGAVSYTHLTLPTSLRV